jgi:hypothetical protein
MEWHSQAHPVQTPCVEKIEALNGSDCGQHGAGQKKELGLRAGLKAISTSRKGPVSKVMNVRDLPPLTPDELKVLGPRYPNQEPAVIDRMAHRPEMPDGLVLPAGVKHDLDHPSLPCPACIAIEEAVSGNRIKDKRGRT